MNDSKVCKPRRSIEYFTSCNACARLKASLPKMIIMMVVTGAEEIVGGSQFEICINMPVDKADLSFDRVESRDLA
jgi:hypothetical protein